MKDRQIEVRTREWRVNTESHTLTEKERERENREVDNEKGGGRERSETVLMNCLSAEVRTVAGAKQPCHPDSR